MGVVDLDDDDPQVAVGVAAEEEAGRVEHVAGDAEVGDERDVPAAWILTLRAEMVEER